MNTSRSIALGGLIAAAGLLMAGNNVEYGQEAYLFPNILASMLIGFALLMLLTEGDLAGWSRTLLLQAGEWFFSARPMSDHNRFPDLVRLIPMFIILGLYLYLADIVGLYVTSYLAFLAIVTVYSPKRPRAQSFIKYVLIASAFMGVIYLIFAQLLQLQTPPALLL